MLHYCDVTVMLRWYQVSVKNIKKVFCHKFRQNAKYVKVATLNYLKR